MRMKQPVRAKKPAPVKGAPRFTRAFGTRTMILLVVCVMGATILMASYQPTHTPPVRPDEAQSRPPVALVQPAPVAADTTVASAATGDPTPGTAAAARPAPVTITGCLEQDAESFRLKNATGEDAPKSRSWKSGFLKKGAAPIDVIDASHRLKLPTHVGQRVSVTGVLVGREMQLRSLQRVAASCNQKS